MLAALAPQHAACDTLEQPHTASPAFHSSALCTAVPAICAQLYVHTAAAVCAACDHQTQAAATASRCEQPCAHAAAAGGTVFRAMRRRPSQLAAVDHLVRAAYACNFHAPPQAQPAAALLERVLFKRHCCFV